MNSFFYNFFSISFDSYKSFISSYNFIDKWEKKRRNTYFSINDLVFKSIYNKSLKSKDHDQFILDFINYFIHEHLSFRFTFLNSNYSKSKFIFMSFVNHYFFSIKTILISIKHNAFKFNLDKLSNINSINISIGFPNHSFNYSPENINNPSSFIEYLMVNKFITEEDNILSIDEYLRPKSKLEKENNSDYPKSFRRITLKKTSNILKLIINFLILPYLFIVYISKFRVFSFSLFSFFIRDYFFSNQFNSIIEKIDKKQIKIKNIFVLNHLNKSGLNYRGKFQSLIKQFNYGQHYVIGTSSINSDLIGSNNTLSLSQILSELPTRLFSEFHLNPINFSSYSKNFSKFRTLINEKYNINTLDISSKIEIDNKYHQDNIFSNLGYEIIEHIKFKSSRNILFFDNTIETIKQNFSNHFLGDILALKNFIYDFHKEIAGISKFYNYNLYFKGKYTNTKILNSMIDEISKSLNINIYIINPYSKVLINDNRKFDLAIHFPFTSTHYTFTHLANKSIYYIPNSYVENFDKNINDICLGEENLKKILN
jgi:hypothetical protein